MRNEFKSIKAYAKTWSKLHFVMVTLRYMGYRLTKSAVLDMGVNLLAKGLKAQLEKMNKEQNGNKK